MNGNVAMSWSTWLYLAERDPLMDYSIIVSDQMLMVLTPQPPATDISLFLRPFTSDSWVSLFAMAVIILAAIAIPYTFFSSFFLNSNSYRITHISAMALVILINAFYGGAMTMFFTSDITIPFEGLRDVMRDPSWKPLIKEGEGKQSLLELILNLNACL